MNFPLVNAFAVFHSFYVMLFKFAVKKFYIFLFLDCPFDIGVA